MACRTPAPCPIGGTRRPRRRPGDRRRGALPGVVEPALFDVYIAVDPSLWWNRQALALAAAARFEAWSAPPRKLYIATSADAQDDATPLLAAIRDHHPAGLVVRRDPMLAEHHNTIFAIAAVSGFRTMFAQP